MAYWVYILASSKHGTLYVGVTRNLERRLSEHRAKMHSGFTAQYGVDRLVWCSTFEDVNAAIRFEKQLKRWRRSWKVRLIEEDNPQWADCAQDWFKPAKSEFMGPGLSLRENRDDIGR